ncbi:MAG: PAS domain S-box protein [Alphaproteobacteria bacterium]
MSAYIPLFRSRATRLSASPETRFRLVAVLSFLLFALSLPTAFAQGGPPAGDAGATRIVRVGIEQFRPLAFYDDSGTASGLAVEILEAIADRENWRLEFVRGTFSELRLKLDDGSVDIVPTIVRTTESARRYRFSTLPYFANWAGVYKRRGENLHVTRDLAGKRVAVVTDDVHGVALARLAENFGFTFVTVNVDGYGPALDAIANGRADAAVISRIYGASHEGLSADDGYSPDVVPTGIVLNPVDLRFAAPLTADPAILAAIDDYLEEVGGSPVSRYFEMLNLWLGQAGESAVPPWFWVIGIVSAAITLLVVGITVISRIQIRRRTRELTAANAEMAAARLQLERVLNSLADGVVVFGADRIIRFSNALAEKFFQTAQETLVGQEFSLAIDAGETNETVISRDDGTSLPMELRASGITFQGEQCTLVSLQDITDRKAAESAVIVNAEKFRSAFESAGYGVALMGLDGRYLEVNATFCDILGRSEDELVGLDFREITHPDDLDAELEEMGRLITDGQAFYRIEKRCRRKDGSEIPVLLSRSAVRAEDGTPQYFVTQAIDISERRKAEEQLRLSQKMEAVGQLTGGIAHDFNNILSIILGNLQLVQRRVTEDSESTKQLERALGATQRAAELTRRLLAFSHHQVLETRAVDPAILITELLPLLERTLGTDIEIETGIDTDVPLIDIDVNQLENAIINLCINSRDAMPGGGSLIVELRLSTLDAAYADAHGFDISTGAYVVLSVSDNGAGMSKETLDRVFEPFFTTKEIGKGTGLGMSMVYGFVKQSGGYVTVYSELGSGTTTKLYLPVSTAGAHEKPDGNVPPPREFRGTERILLVDDNADIRATLSEVLRAIGYTVIEAEDGPAAIDLMSRGAAFDILVTDVMMPGGIQGPALVKAVRERYPDIPAILQSGYSGRMIVPSELLDHQTAYLAKPFPNEVLAEQIRSLLDDR